MPSEVFDSIEGKRRLMEFDAVEGDGSTGESDIQQWRHGANSHEVWTGRMICGWLNKLHAQRRYHGWEFVKSASICPSALVTMCGKSVLPTMCSKGIAPRHELWLLLMMQQCFYLPFPSLARRRAGVRVVVMAKCVGRHADVLLSSEVGTVCH